MNGADLSTRDLTTCRLRLSEELIVAPQQHGEMVYYHIEAPSKGKFYRVGFSEYVLLSLLDGHTTLAHAVTLAVRALGPQALTQAQALEVANWLLENDLAQIADDRQGMQRTSGSSNTAKSDWSQRLQRLNPFWLKIPLWNPDRMLARLLPACGWLFSHWTTGMGLVLIGVGTCVIGLHWSAFLASSQLIFSPHNWPLMFLVWILLKIVHEMGHALVCKRYGGEVREMGMVLILFAPAAYVDVTSSWRFSSKWQRIHVAASGMYVELVLAAIAAILWNGADSLVVRHALFNVILMASLSTVLFNANPLMRFDGYYLLADLLEIPNLATEGARFVQQLSARLFLGTRSTSPERLGPRGWWIRGYGMAAWIWRLVVCASLLAASSLLFHGAGILLGIGGLIAWFGGPCFRLARNLYRQFHETPVTVVRAGIVAGGIAAVLWVALAWMPWPTSISAPAIVEYTDLSIVRSRVDGFVAKIHVRDGQHVQAGEPLIELANDEMQTEMRQLELSVSEATVLHRSALDEHDAARAQVALGNRKALLERLAEIRQQCDHLRVVAPVDGRVVARNLQNLIGTYVQEGDELMAVGDERRKELLVSIAQDQVDEILPRIGRTTHFRLGDAGIREGILLRVDPRATRELPHAALSALAGGPLAVSEDADDPGRPSRWLVEPRFPGVVAIAPDNCELLACGDRGYVLFGLRRESAGLYLWNGFRNWLLQLGESRRR